MSGPTGASSLMSSSALTPAEEAYFTTRGEDTSAFAAPSNEPAPAAGTPAPDAVSSPAPAGTPAAPAIPGAEPAAPAAAIPGAEPTDDELIDQTEADAIGEDGKPRSGGEFVRRKNFRVVSDKMKTFRSERDAYKAKLDATDQELSKLREDRARLDERLRLFNEALQQPATPSAPAAPAAPAAPPTPPPDPNVDPIGALQYVLQKIPELTGGIDKVQQAATATQTTLSDADSYQRTAAAFQTDAQRFVAAGNADFAEAYQHGLNARAQMYFHAGVTDRAEIQRRVREDERAVVETALKSGKSPAEVMYGMAQALGYQKKAVPAPAAVDPAAAAAAQAAPAAAAAPAAPAPAAPAAPAAAAPSAADEVARMAAAQAASKTLSNAGGGTPVMQMTIERLLKMSDSEFSAYERQNPGVVATLMGKE